MERRSDPAGGGAAPRAAVRPRGLVSRALIAAGIFAAAVLPAWTLGDAAERWTGLSLLDWIVTCLLSGVAVYVLAPYGSYRRRDAVLGAVPFLGWYLISVLSWRIALLPLRDWEPREDELWRARWLTGDLIGFWRADPLPPPSPRRTGAGPRVRSGSAPRAGRPTR